MILFPAAERFAELRPLVEDLLGEHRVLRDFFAKAGAGRLDRGSLKTFGETLSAHIRKEERQLFEGMQQRLGAEELSKIGAALEKELAAASDACLLPNAATRLRGRKDP